MINLSYTINISLTGNCYGLSQELRKQLNLHGFSHVQIIAADLIGSDSWSIADDMAKNKSLNNSVDIIG